VVVLPIGGSYARVNERSKWR